MRRENRDADVLTWSSTREDYLAKDSHKVQISKRAAPILECSFSRKQPQKRCDHERSDEMNDSIGEPCGNVEERMREPSEDVGDICAIQNGLECWEEGDADWGSVRNWYKAG